VVIQEHTFTAGAEDVARATANVVEIRGGGEDRIPIRALANDQGAVMVSVPGGVTFQLVREEGSWFRIKLLDGKEGYVQKDKAKLRPQ
jgi:3-phosphoglycerate kinase